MSQIIVVRNAGFDEPFYEQDGVSQLKVANGWRCEWEDGPNSAQGFLVRPECYPKLLLDPTQVFVDYCQGIQSTSATHRAAFVQAVALPAGVKNLVLEARVAYHGPASGMAARIGLDGTGQVREMDAPTIHWGSWLNQEGFPAWEGGKWTIAKASLAEAETGYVSIWLLAQNKWRDKNNHVFWRDVSLEADGPGPDPDPGSAAELIMQAVDLLLEAVAKL